MAWMAPEVAPVGLLWSPPHPRDRTERRQASRSATASASPPAPLPLALSEPRQGAGSVTTPGESPEVLSLAAIEAAATRLEHLPPITHEAFALASVLLSPVSDDVAGQMRGALSTVSFLDTVTHHEFAQLKTPPPASICLPGECRCPGGVDRRQLAVGLPPDGQERRASAQVG